VNEVVIAGLTVSYTHSSYEDMTRVASIVHQAMEIRLKATIPFLVTSGSEEIRVTVDWDGVTQSWADAGARVLTNASGQCNDQGNREEFQREEYAILTS